jgi:hypothetical protein
MADSACGNTDADFSRAGFGDREFDRLQRGPGFPVLRKVFRIMAFMRSMHLLFHL